MGLNSPMQHHHPASGSRLVHRVSLLACGLFLFTPACAATAQGPARDAARPGIEVLALSRGAGVPEATRQVFEAIVARVEAARAEGRVVEINQSIIGLEGETRLCVVFTDEVALELLGPELRDLSAGVELLQLRQNGCSRQ
jgi:hypothetical protein